MYEPPKSALSESVTARLAWNSMPFVRAEPALALSVRPHPAGASGADVRNGTPCQSIRKPATEHVRRSWRRPNLQPISKLVVSADLCSLVHSSARVEP